MTLDVAAHIALLAISFVLTLLGAVAAQTAENVWKRLSGVVAALVGAALGCAALNAGSGVVIVVGAIAFAYCAVGVALGVRIQEAYGSAETGALDRADAESEPRERGS